METERDSKVFINIIEKDALHYLLHVGSIFNFKDEAKITNPNKAIGVFTEYFQDILAKYVDLERIDFFAREIEHRYLILFYRELGIQDIDYEIKTKVKSLYVSVFIQRTIMLRISEPQSSFLETSRAAMKELITKCNDGNLIHDMNDQVQKLHVEKGAEEDSFLRFYLCIKEAQRWQTHAKWEKLAFYTASFACGEGVWYCLGGAAKPETLRRKILFSMIEKKDNKYNKCVKKRKTPIMTPMSAMIPPGASGLNTANLSFGFSAIGLPTNAMNYPMQYIPASGSNEVVYFQGRLDQGPITIPSTSDGDTTRNPMIIFPLATPSESTEVVPQPTENSTGENDTPLIDSSDPLAFLANAAELYEKMQISATDQTTTPATDQTTTKTPTEVSPTKKKKLSGTSKKALGAMGFNPLLLYPYLPPPEDYTRLLSNDTNAKREETKENVDNVDNPTSYSF